MAGKGSLSAAKGAKNDEFYTQLTDVENELKHYRKYFKDKTVFCNCDDPFESNFFKYFVLNFNRLGLKKLIATCYTGSPIAGTQLSIFDVIGDAPETINKPYKAIVTQVYDKTGDGGVDMFDVAELFRSGENSLELLDDDGDFRSSECLALMDESDIVVTNPPFSLFREYVATLVEKKKMFIILGNMNAITYKEIFPLLKDNKVWLGYRDLSKDMYFDVPDTRKKWLVENKKEGSAYKIIDGVVKGRLASACWFTNLDIKKRHEELICIKKYNSSIYPPYDNYKAIEVSKTAEIPLDYKGVMGVPITFMDKYNPDQFEIVGLSVDGNYPEEIRRHPNCYYDGYVWLCGKNKEKTHRISSWMPLLNTGDYNGTTCIRANSPNLYQIYHRLFIRYTEQWISSHPDDFKEN